MMRNKEAHRMAMQNVREDTGKKEYYWKRQYELNGAKYEQNVNTIAAALMDNRGYIFEDPVGETVIVMCSGGMDSITLVDVAIRRWKCNVIMLYFRRDAKNQKWEEQAVDFFYEFYKERHPENMLELVKLDIQIPSRVNKEHFDRVRQKIMGLPLRNATMWCNAFAQAVYLSGKYKTTIRTILVGSVMEDGDNPESGILSILAQTLLACIGMGLWYYQIRAPFIEGKGWNKEDLIKHCRIHGIPIKKSRSCFGYDEEPCHECTACVNRDRAFEKFK
jgi:7-cyano-7-deazaguanine synthase in queuosine biosynthesis